MTRKSGYYLVKHEGVWDIAFYFELFKNRMVWMFCGREDDYSDSDMDKINETRILAPDGVSDE